MGCPNLPLEYFFSLIRPLHFENPLSGFSNRCQRDPIGNRKAEKRNGGTFEYKANNLNQYSQRTVPGTVNITGSAEETAQVSIQQKSNSNIFKPDRLGKYYSRSFSFDNSANPVEETFKVYGVKYDSVQQKDIVAQALEKVFLAKTPELFSYDPDGNLLSDGRFTYTWDGENRLVSLESGTGVSPVTRIKVEFSYDYIGRRISKKVYNWVTDNWSLVTDYKYTWNGWSLIAVLNASNQLQRSYCWGEDGLISDTDAASGKTYLAVRDGNMNITGYVDAADGKLVASYEYDAFGRCIVKDERMGLSASGGFNFRFSSYQFDSESGLVYYGYRYYNPETGRFMGRDPIEEDGGENIYDFCLNDGVNGIDYLGLYNPTVHIALSKAAYAKRKNDAIYKGKVVGIMAKMYFIETLSRGAVAPDVVYIGSGFSSIPAISVTSGTYSLYKANQPVIETTVKVTKDAAELALFPPLYYLDKAASMMKSGVKWAAKKATPDAVVYWWQDTSFVQPAVNFASWAYKPAGDAIKNIDIYKSHYGSDMWMHGMRTKGQSAQAIRDQIVNDQVSLIEEYRKNPCNGFPLGKALHYLQDTRTPSHTWWKNGSIYRFQDYNAQSPYLHKLADQTPVNNISGLSDDFIGIANDVNLANGALKIKIEALYPLAPDAEGGDTHNDYLPRPRRFLGFNLGGGK